MSYGLEKHDNEDDPLPPPSLKPLVQALRLGKSKDAAEHVRAVLGEGGREGKKHKEEKKATSAQALELGESKDDGEHASKREAMKQNEENEEGKVTSGLAAQAFRLGKSKEAAEEHAGRREWMGRQVWMWVAEYPRTILIRGNEDVIAFRILPDFCGDVTSMTREALIGYLRVLASEWDRLRDACEVQKWTTELEQSSPLVRVESGVWWARILLEGCLNEQTSLENGKMSNDANDENEAIASRALKKSLAMDSIRRVCGAKVIEREIKHFTI